MLFVVAFDLSFGVFLLLGDIMFIFVIFEEYQPIDKSTFANKGIKLENILSEWESTTYKMLWDAAKAMHGRNLCQ